jgi:K+-transporting ATPase KdpF subunit
MAEDRPDGRGIAQAKPGTQDGAKDRRALMIYLGGILVLALLAYLVFVLLRPEKF